MFSSLASLYFTFYSTSFLLSFTLTLSFIVFASICLLIFFLFFCSNHLLSCPLYCNVFSLPPFPPLFHCLPLLFLSFPPTLFHFFLTLISFILSNFLFFCFYSFSFRLLISPSFCPTLSFLFYLSTSSLLHYLLSLSVISVYFYSHHSVCIIPHPHTSFVLLFLFLFLSKLVKTFYPFLLPFNLFLSLLNRYIWHIFSG